MKIIIVGDGKVGYALAESLSKEDNDVTIIDKDAEALKKVDGRLDVMCIKGNGLSTKILLEAGVREADLIIAVTTSDEMNMVCCLTAKKLGARHTIARIRDPEYSDELSQLKADLGLDMVINPEQAAAGEIARLIEFPPAFNVEIFSKGYVEMVEIKVKAGMSVAGMRLRDISGKILSSILIAAVVRGEEVVIPKGDFEIKESDLIYIIGRPSIVFNFCRKIGVYIQKIKKLMIVGGGRIAYYLAKYLDEMDIKVKIIESDSQRCVELTELLPHALIISGDGSDETVLQSENLSDMDAFVSVTGRDEENLMTALMARQMGVKKIVSKINRFNYIDLIKDMGIDNIISPKLITTNYILRYIRGMKSAKADAVQTLYRIIGGRVEAIEFAAATMPGLTDIPLKKLNIISGVLVAAIVRKNNVIIPGGEDMIKADDSVIVIAMGKKLAELSDIVQTEE